MLLGQELKFKNKLCNLKLGTFFSALPGQHPGYTRSQQCALQGQKLKNVLFFKVFSHFPCTIQIKNVSFLYKTKMISLAQGN